MVNTTKHQRSGQPGNQNARKCGFYSRFSPQELGRLVDLLHSENIFPEFTKRIRIILTFFLIVFNGFRHGANNNIFSVLQNESLAL
jgi:hypothetical protein